MSQRTRIGIIIVVIGLGLAIGGFYVLSVIIRTNLQPLPPPTPETIILERVVVATRDIPVGDLLTAGDLEEVEVPVQLIPRNALRDVDQGVEKFTKVQLVAGEMVMFHNLADPTNVNHDLAYVLEDNQVLMAFPVLDLMSQLDIIQRGDLIDVFITTDVELPVDDTVVVITGDQQETESQTMTLNAFQRVRITALVVEIVEGQQQQAAPLPAVGGEGGEAAPTPVPQNVNIQAFLLALDPQDALVLKYLKDAGATFDFVIRSPASAEFFDLTPVTEKYIIDRYQLEFSR